MSVFQTGTTTEKDFLCGRERSCRDNGGNQLVLKLAAEYLAEFKSADAKSDYLDEGTKRDIMVIKMEIVKKIKESGGRFLKKGKTKGIWVEIADKDACAKVKEAFRRVDPEAKTKGGNKKRRRNDDASPVSAADDLSTKNMVATEDDAGARDNEGSHPTSSQQSDSSNSSHRVAPELKDTTCISQNAGVSSAHVDGSTRVQRGGGNFARRVSHESLQGGLRTGTAVSDVQNGETSVEFGSDSTYNASFSNDRGASNEQGFTHDFEPVEAIARHDQTVPEAWTSAVNPIKYSPGGLSLRNASFGYHPSAISPDIACQKPTFSTHKHCSDTEKPPPSPCVLNTSHLKDPPPPSPVVDPVQEPRSRACHEEEQPDTSSGSDTAAGLPPLDIDFLAHLLAEEELASCDVVTGRKKGKEKPLTDLVRESDRSEQESLKVSLSGSAVELDFGSRRCLKRRRTSQSLDACSNDSFSHSITVDPSRDPVEVSNVSGFDCSERARFGIGGSGLSDFNPDSDRSGLLKDSLDGMPMCPIDNVEASDFALIDFGNSVDHDGEEICSFDDERSRTSMSRSSLGRHLQEEDVDSDIRSCKTTEALGVKACFLSVVALACIIPIAVLAPSQGQSHDSPTHERKSYYSSIIQARSPSTSFDTASSPQARALDWMVNDTYSTSLSDEDRLLQRFGLATLWYSTGEWDSALPWLTSTNECEHWGNESVTDGLGLSCNLLNAVELLMLGGDVVKGTIPPEILFLTDLLALELVSSNLEGTLPTTIGECTSLVDLTIMSTNIEGTIPSELGLLSALETVDLSDNNLGGTIPTFLGLLASLEIIDLSGNRLSGRIPDFAGQWINLAGLILWNNTLTGLIPSDLGLLSLLKVVQLGFNQLEGSLPESLGQWVNVVSLDLENNTLTGTIPSELGLLTAVEVIDLKSNELSGNIPSELGLLTHLEALDLSNNNLVGSLPTALGRLLKLRSLFLENNSLTGPIPLQFQNLTGLEQVDLCGNRLVGLLMWIREILGITGGPLSVCDPDD
mmetsp:Transcript_33779/g.50085  ORF Transcript_33779/g.50085 Transcript_33779/m.50085 type:complete len:1024 (-) Transcript_33779:245-3316(-)|eukprot:CAMPEP_0194044272 /NCGR_PEP_ID=MMETSP0009_2-20130614/15764_1 /TAXON_ID=210454 /ORGANISM="Grammatophora oceanica, Strain CCMP 410" /LENGTH=1023 /DNA_ID=CAMNT_0038688743 /DNA_START=2482 /DNA_END=5553 /DNA_ORIENTATION=-